MRPSMPLFSGSGGAPVGMYDKYVTTLRPTRLHHSATLVLASSTW